MAKRIRTSNQHLWIARDGPRVVLAAMMLIFVAATSLSDGKLFPDFLTERARVAHSNSEQGDDLRTGSILITPAFGNICEHRVIDNETWRIRRNGSVACDAAGTWQPGRTGAYTPQQRLEAIRDGFVSKH